MTQNYNFSEVNSRFFDYASNSYRRYFQNLLVVQEQALQVSKALLSGVDSLYSQTGQPLVREFSNEMARAQSQARLTWQEINNNGLNFMQATAKAAIQPVVTLLDINERMEELAAQVEQTVELAVRVTQLENDKTRLENENSKLAARLDEARTNAQQVKTLEAEKAQLESEQAKLERANTRLEHKVENVTAKAEQAAQLESDLAIAENERVRLERANTRLEHKLETAPAKTENKESGKDNKK